MAKATTKHSKKSSKKSPKALEKRVAPSGFGGPALNANPNAGNNLVQTSFPNEAPYDPGSPMNSYVPPRI